MLEAKLAEAGTLKKLLDGNVLARTRFFAFGRVHLTRFSLQRSKN